MVQNLEGEEWRDVGIVKGVDFTGYYQVSNKKRVKSVGRIITRKDGRKMSIKEKIKEQYLDPIRGYWTVNFTKYGKNYNMQVHRLLAMAFIPNPNNLPVVNHLDENRSNNDLTNLAWCTVRENNMWGTAIDRRVEKTGSPIVQLDINGDVVKAWRSAKDADKNGYDDKSLTLCLLGKQKTNHGYKWSYIKDDNEYRNISYKDYINVDVPLFSENYVSLIDPVKVVQIDPVSKEVVLWKSMLNAEKNGYRASSIWACINGNYKVHNGCRWMRLIDFEKQYGSIDDYSNCTGKESIFDFNLYIKVVQLTKDDVPLKLYNSMKETEQYGFRADGVDACLREFRKTSFGFKWMTYDDFVSQFGDIKIAEPNISEIAPKKQKKCKRENCTTGQK